ncbi:MAG: hypothetical protein HY719_03650 [Planctomycetes bacterium]|nr:hypothetical protein [Planctomycetota bacterium]
MASRRRSLPLSTVKGSLAAAASAGLILAFALACTKPCPHCPGPVPWGPGYAWSLEAVPCECVKGSIDWWALPVTGPQVRNRTTSRVIQATGDVREAEIYLYSDPQVGGGKGFEWDGVVNFERLSGRILSYPEVRPPYLPIGRFRYYYYLEQSTATTPPVAGERTEYVPISPFPTAEELPLVDNQPYVHVNDANNWNFAALLVFPGRVDSLFVAFSQRDGLPPPSVTASEPLAGAAVDWWRRAGDKLQVVFDFDQEMVCESPFPNFVVSHTLAVPVTFDLSEKRLTIAFQGPIDAGPHQVTLNPPGFAPLLRSASGRVLAPFTLNFEVR